LDSSAKFANVREHTCKWHTPQPRKADAPFTSTTQTRLGLIAVCLIALLLAGCSSGSDTIAAQAKAGDGKGYVAGDGTIEQIDPTQRSTAITLTGSTLEGGGFDSTTLRGKVVVINTWGSWCPPCNAEAPVLQRTWTALKTKDVQFVGVDVRDNAPTGMTFQRKYGITYPSVGWDGGRVLLQLQGKASATPTTLVLDRQGRLAGRISGEASGSTLQTMVEDVLKESA
jgi:thiol-disulfide isomerase/thioredoxin